MRSIEDFLGKIKSFWADFIKKAREIGAYLKPSEDLFVATLIILVGILSYGLGKLSAFETAKTPITIIPTTNTDPTTDSVQIQSQSQTGAVVASKSGTRYYFPNCSGASRIKDENKVWYATEAAAQAKGLTLASGCSK